MCDRKKIAQLAGVFRTALLSSQIDKLMITLNKFPLGACGDASYLLAKYLESNGCGSFEYVKGARDMDDYSHVWLEKNGLIVDITADQYDGQENSVLVTTDRSWHAQFKETERSDSDFEKLDNHTVYNLSRSYEIIMEELS